MDDQFLYGGFGRNATRELFIPLDLGSTTGETDVMNLPFEWPDAKNDPNNEDQRVLLDMFRLAKIRHIADI